MPDGTSGKSTVRISMQSKAAAARNAPHNSSHLGRTRPCVRDVVNRVEPLQNQWMGDRGLKDVRFPSGNTTIVREGSAESGAQSPLADGDPLLAVIVSAWPRLSQEQRIRVIEAAMVDPAAGCVIPLGDT